MSPPEHGEWFLFGAELFGTTNAVAKEKVEVKLLAGSGSSWSILKKGFINRHHILFFTSI